MWINQDNFRDTDTTTQIGKHGGISVSVLSNLIEQPVFLGNSNPAVLVESFNDALDGLPMQSKTHMQLKFLEVATSVKSKPNQFFLRS